MLPSFLSNFIWGEEEEANAKDEETLVHSATEEAGDWLVITRQMSSEHGEIAFILASAP